MTNAPTRRFHFTLVMLIVGFLALTAAGRADALCLDNLLHRPATSTPSSPARTLPSPHAAPAVYRIGAPSGALFMPVSDVPIKDDPIVGLWEFQISGNVPPDSAHRPGIPTARS